MLRGSLKCHPPMMGHDDATINFSAECFECVGSMLSVEHVEIRVQSSSSELLLCRHGPSVVGKPTFSFSRQIPDCQRERTL